MLLFTLCSNFSRLLYTNHFSILSPYRVSQERILMRGAIPVQAIILLLLCFRVLSQSDGSTAPMEEKEKEALYLMIQGFVGNWWNGSGLYPDPCGWTSIQVYTNLFTIALKIHLIVILIISTMIFCYLFIYLALMNLHNCIYHFFSCFLPI